MGAWRSLMLCRHRSKWCSQCAVGGAAGGGRRDGRIAAGVQSASSQPWTWWRDARSSVNTARGTERIRIIILASPPGFLRCIHHASQLAPAKPEVRTVLYCFRAEAAQRLNSPNPYRWAGWAGSPLFHCDCVEVDRSKPTISLPTLLDLHTV